MSYLHAIHWHDNITRNNSWFLSDTPSQWWKFDTTIDKISCIYCFLRWWQKEWIVVFFDEKIRCNRFRSDEKKSEQYDNCEKKIHRHSSDENERACPPGFRCEAICIGRLWTSWIFSLDTHESSDWKCIECIFRSFFVREESKYLRRYTESEFEHSHPCHARCQEMPKLMNQNDNKKNQKCQQNSKYNIHNEK